MTQNMHERTSKYGRRFNAGKRKKRVVVGGDPNSGKSVFMNLLRKDLKEKGLDVELLDLDFFAPTQNYLSGEDRGPKREPYPGVGKDINHHFKRVSRENDLTLGDTPGRISEHTRDIVHNAHGAIVLAKDDTAKKRWTVFFGKKKIHIITVVDSRLTDKMNWYSPKKNRGVVTNLNREDLRAGRIDSDNIVIEGVSFEIAQYFGYVFKQQ